MEDIKQFFLPGDEVILRQDLPNKPTMYVVKKVTRTMTVGGVKNDYFQGILCRWFNKLGDLKEEIFNTKDLRKLN